MPKREPNPLHDLVNPFARDGADAQHDSASDQGPFSPILNSVLSASFGVPLNDLSVSRNEDSRSTALNAHAYTHDGKIGLSSQVQEDLGDGQSMEVIAHEVSHALAGEGEARTLVDKPGDTGETAADAAGEVFRHYIEDGMQGPPPQLHPAEGGDALIHRHQIEGPWNVNDPVHETLTQESLKRAGLIKQNETYNDPAAFDYARGVFWNDDPQTQLFDNNKTGFFAWANFSAGKEWYDDFSAYEAAAANGTEYGKGSPLLARTHFGDMQPLHGMATKDGEDPKDTQARMMMWAEFTTKVAIGEIPANTPLSQIDIPGFEMFSTDDKLKDKSVDQLFGVDGTGGDARKRAMGSMLHMIQDSYAGGHVEREDLGDNHKGKILGFHSYANQDHDKHGEDDAFAPGASTEEIFNNMPGAWDAVNQGAEVLKLLNKEGASWEEVQKYLKTNTFALSEDAKAASAGENYKKDPQPIPTPQVEPTPTPPAEKTPAAARPVIDPETLKRALPPIPVPLPTPILQMYQD